MRSTELDNVDAIGNLVQHVCCRLGEEIVTIY